MPSIELPLRGVVRLGVVSATPVAVRRSGPALLDELEALASELGRRYEGRSPSEIDALAPARELYRSFGVDPTKTRPSSEALLRRVLGAKPLPRIVNAVDVCNMLSLRFLLPIGLYDSAKIAGDVELRRGRPGESFAGIRKADVHLEGRPVLVDSRGPFGNPTSDSLRTSVGEGTSALWMVIFAPGSLSAATMEADVREARSVLQRHLAPDNASVTTTGTVLA